jgi:serine/threonine protein kinase
MGMTTCLLGERYQYQLGDTVGRGDLSVVHRGRDVRLDRDVAIKMLRSDLARDPSVQKRFRREAQNAGTLNHPAIVAVYDTGETSAGAGRVPYIVMEYVDGETLAELLARQGRLPPEQAVFIAAEICAALDFSHRLGIVHRDIKPANVMLDRSGAVKVMDFGITRGTRDGGTMTSPSARIGTALYVSPEQVRGQQVDARTDVYSTGCVLYEMLTGAPPFTGGPAVKVADRHVREAPQAPSSRVTALSPQLDAVVLKALSKNPLNRYQTAADMRADLLRASAALEVPTPALAMANAHAGATNETSAREATGESAPLMAPPVLAAPEWMWQTDEDKPQARGWALAGAGALALALAMALWLTLRVVTAPPTPPLVAVPDLTGMTLSQATAQLQTSHLTLGTVSKIDSAPKNKDKVVVQRPSGKTQVDQDSAVNLEMGTGVRG